MDVNKREYNNKQNNGGFKVMHKELKRAIVYWLLDHEYEFQRVNACTEHFRPYIYDASGNHLIGGEDVYNFIIKVDKTLYGEFIN